MPHHNSTDSCLLTQGSLDHGHTAYSSRMSRMRANFLWRWDVMPRLGDTWRWCKNPKIQL